MLLGPYVSTRCLSCAQVKKQQLILHRRGVGSIEMNIKLFGSESNIKLLRNIEAPIAEFLFRERLETGNKIEADIIRNFCENYAKSASVEKN